MKILVIRFSSIGDIVLTSPVIRCLKEQTGCELHFLTKEAYRPILESNPHIDHLHVLGESLTETIRTLKSLEFDWIIDLHKNWRSFRVRLSLGVKAKSFPKLNFKKWLLVNSPWNNMPDIHIVERYLFAVKHLGVKNDGMGLEYFPGMGNKEKIIRFLSENLPSGYKKFKVLVVGAKHFTKQIPERLCQEICLALHPLPIILLGGKDEAEKAARIAGDLPNAINAAGILSLNESAALISLADAVITGDTGMMHVAAAFRRPTIAVWGNTLPELGMSPYVPEKEKFPVVNLENKDLPCRPCSKIGKSECPKKHFECMRFHTAESIMKALQSAKGNFIPGKDL